MKKIVDIETLSLESTVGKILCIVSCDIDSKITDIFSGEDEKLLLNQFWNSIDDNSDIIAFNGDEFDVSFLITRSIINSVKIKKINSIDLRKIVNSYYLHGDKYRKGSLRVWGQLLGLQVETHDGSQIAELYYKGDWDSITKHCLEDVKICKTLMTRCQECGLI